MNESLRLPEDFVHAVSKGLLEELSSTETFKWCTSPVEFGCLTGYIDKSAKCSIDLWPRGLNITSYFWHENIHIENDRSGRFFVILECLGCKGAEKKYSHIILKPTMGEVIEVIKALGRDDPERVFRYEDPNLIDNIVTAAKTVDTLFSTLK